MKNSNSKNEYIYTVESQISDLKKQFDYYYMFNLTKEFANLLSKVITEREGKQYLCRTVEYECEKKSICKYTEPYMDYELQKFNGELVSVPSYHSEEEKEIIIPKRGFTYLIIYECKNEEFLSSNLFKNQEDMNRMIRKYTVFDVECTSFIMSSIFPSGEKVYTADFSKLEQKFSYLKYLFFMINQWRKDNMRFTLDETAIEVLVKHIKKICRITIYLVKYMQLIHN